MALYLPYGVSSSSGGTNANSVVRILDNNSLEFNDIHPAIKTFVAPSNKIWLVQSLSFKYQASALVAQRNVYCESDKLYTVNSRYQHLENKTIFYKFAVNGRDSSVTDGENIVQVKLPQVKLPPQTLITCSALSYQTEDLISDILLCVEEWEAVN